MHRIPGDTFRMGSDDPLLAYDNERPVHEVTVAPFRLDAAPVSTARWLAFLADGGYRRPDLWHPDGWAWRCENAVEMPEYWRRLPGGSFGYVSDCGLVPLDPEKPANALSWYEADAYARWAGRRLPTEAEWEYAAGRLGLSGGVWEWTDSPFLPYPGFEAFPYDGYSKAHMDGKHFVCKGGSWATAADIRRPAFRNWYVPTYRQGFLGVRCAADD